MDSTSFSFTLKYLPLTNGETYAYRDIGTNPNVILLLHGALSSSKFFDTLAPILTKEFLVICPDMRGLGYSSYNKRINDLQDIAYDIKLFVDGLGIMKFSILGWSTGGGVASIFAAKYPEYVKFLILLCAIEPKGFHMMKINPDGTKRSFMNREELLNDPLSIHIIDILKRKDHAKIKALLDKITFTLKIPSKSRYNSYVEETTLQRNYDDILSAIYFFNITNEDTAYSKGLNLVKNIQAKTLILQGDHDNIIPPSDNWLKALGGEDKAIWKIFKNCMHCPLEDCLDELVQSIFDFINNSMSFY